MIRIVLVDDHTVVREALRILLEQDAELRVVGEAGDGKSALQLSEALQPDLVVMDISLPGMDGIETTSVLRKSQPQVRVLALSTSCHARAIKQMFQAGATGFIVKSAAAVALKHGIRAVMQGGNYLCPQAAQAIADELSDLPSTPAETLAQQLSRRELEVAIALARGGSASVVAGLLHIADSTVEVHRRNILRKLGLHKSVDLTRVLMQAGLLLPKN